MSVRKPCIYILASERNGTLYAGVTSDLATRIDAHKANQAVGFTSHHNVHTLVHVETFETMTEAITREKQLKAGSRKKKIALIEKNNPRWKDISHLL